MKLLTLIGTRPEIIRLSNIIPKLDKQCEQILVHTGQNYDYNLSQVFMEEFGLREPDHYLGIAGSFPEQLATLGIELDKILEAEKPDALLVLGDTNSSLGAIFAKRRGIKVYHMEAGNRCHDDRSPEETNRKLIDHSTDIHMPYTERSRQNLLDEGIANKDIYVVGNPMAEVLNNRKSTYKDSDREFILVTLHRAENVDDPKRLNEFVNAFTILADMYDKDIIWSVHPHTRKRLEGFTLHPSIKLTEPMNFSEFISHENSAWRVLTDSGTVQEECAILHTPCITLRDSTERPETIETGSNIVTGCDADTIVNAVGDFNGAWWPDPYLKTNISNIVCNIILGKL